MKFKHGIPNHDAFSDLFPAIDARHTAARHSEGSQGTPATIGACFEDPKSAELTTVTRVMDKLCFLLECTEWRLARRFCRF